MMTLMRSTMVSGAPIVVCLLFDGARTHTLRYSTTEFCAFLQKHIRTTLIGTGIPSPPNLHRHVDKGHAAPFGRKDWRGNSIFAGRSRRRSGERWNIYLQCCCLVALRLWHQPFNQLFCFSCVLTYLSPHFFGLTRRDLSTSRVASYGPSSSLASSSSSSRT